MSLICRLFGHRPPETRYMRTVPGEIDSLGSEHATLVALCPRCDREYIAARTILPMRYAEKALRRATTKGKP